MSLFSRLAFLAASCFIVVAVSVYAGQIETSDKTYTNEQIDAYVRVLENLVDLNTSYAPKFEAAQEETERAALSDELIVRMQEIVEAEGLTVEIYEAIGKSAHTDPELGQRILAIMSPYGMSMPDNHPGTLPENHPPLNDAQKAPQHEGK